MAPVSMDHPLTLADVQHLPGVDGVPFAAVAATIDSGDLGSLQVITGRLMTERTAMLARYRLNVYLFASVAAILLALSGYLLVHRGLLPLRRLARTPKASASATSPNASTARRAQGAAADDRRLQCHA